MIKNSSTFFLVAVVAITAWAAGVASVAAQSAATARPDLTGQWRLNAELSDDAEDKLQSLRAGRGDAGHGSGRHGGGIFGGGRVGSEDMHAQLQELILNAPSLFVLTQDEQKVVLTEPNGRVRTLPTNNSKVKIDGRDIRTRWESSRLVSETAVGNAKLVETYERSPGAQQLIVTARVKMNGQQMSFRRVYDAESPRTAGPDSTELKADSLLKGTLNGNVQVLLSRACL